MYIEKMLCNAIQNDVMRCAVLRCAAYEKGHLEMLCDFCHARTPLGVHLILENNHISNYKNHKRSTECGGVGVNKSYATKIVKCHE